MASGDEASAADPASGSVWMISAGPFTRADRFRHFLAAVAAIEGVTDVVPQRFRLGVLCLSLRYHGSQPLAGCLATLAEFSPRVEPAGNWAIRLVLGEAGEEEDRMRG